MAGPEGIRQEHVIVAMPLGRCGQCHASTWGHCGYANGYAMAIREASGVASGNEWWVTGSVAPSFTIAGDYAVLRQRPVHTWSGSMLWGARGAEG